MTEKAQQPLWRTSSYTERQDCVELAALGNAVIGIRDSKNPEAGHLPLDPSTFKGLVNRIKTGKLDLE